MRARGAVYAYHVTGQMINRQIVILSLSLFQAVRGTVRFLRTRRRSSFFCVSVRIVQLC